MKKIIKGLTNKIENKLSGIIYEGYFEDFLWFGNNYLDLQRNYPQHYVVIKGKQVISSSLIKKEVLKDTFQQGFSLNTVLLRYVA